MAEQTEQEAAAAAEAAERLAAEAVAEAERLAAAAAAKREEAAAAAAREAQAAETAEADDEDEDALSLRPPITDIEVAAWLERFQERSLEDQQASEVWQALAGFPQWMGAQYREEPMTAEMPPDPRLRGEYLRKELERRGLEPEETLPAAQKADGTNAITTGAAGNAPNPWAEHPEPQADGPLFVAVNTNVRPPYRGNWKRVDGGWFREE